MPRENYSEKPKARFYADDELTAPSVRLPDAEAVHAGKARRLRDGSAVELFNGRGGVRSGILETGSVRFTEPLRRFPESRHRLLVAVSPPKGDRMTFLVEKLSELGADVLIPTIFERSLDAGVKAGTAKIRKWRRVAVESAKQCRRPWLLEVKAPEPLGGLKSLVPSIDLAVVFETDQAPFEQLLAPTAPASGLLIVGPEGGITSKELSGLEIMKASLGSRILRIETAALAATAIYRSKYK